MLVLKNVKRKHNSKFKVLLQSSESWQNFCCFITPTNNNLAETGQFVMLY